MVDNVHLLYNVLITIWLLASNKTKAGLSSLPAEYFQHEEIALKREDPHLSCLWVWRTLALQKLASHSYGMFQA